MFLDFAEAYERDPSQAISALQTLLLDERACRARVDFLRSLAELAACEFPDLPAGPPSQDFCDMIRALLDVGTARALELGLTTPERLHTLSCDPEALRWAHEALTGDPTAIPAPASASPFTTLMAGGQISELIERLRPVLPAILQAVGLPIDHADRLRQFLKERLGAGVRGRRFRELIPGWLEEFAHLAGLGALPRPLDPGDWRRIVERAVMLHVLRQRPAGEPPWAEEYRETALQRGAESWEDLQAITLPEPYAQQAADDLPMFRRDLIFQVQQDIERYCQVLELH